MTADRDDPCRLILRASAALWVCALVLAMSPMTLDPASPPKIMLTAVFGAVFMLAAGFSRPRAAGTPPFVMLAWAWVAWQAACALRSPFPQNALFALHYPALLALAATGAAWCMRTPRQFFRWTGFFLAAMTAAAGYALAQRLGHDPFPWSNREVAEYRLLPATFGNPNIAGHALALGIAAAAVMVTRNRLALIPLAVLLLHLHATRMRGGPLALAAAGVLFVAFHLAGRRVKAPAARAAASLLLAALVLSAGAGLLMARNHAREGLWFPSDGSMVLRYNGWFGAVEMFRDHPVTGVGPGNYALSNAEYWTPFERRWFALKGMKNAHAHNEYLETAAETGLPGLFLLFCLIAWPLVAGLRLAARGPTPDGRRVGWAAALTACVAAVDALFGFNLHTPVAAGFFFFVSGALAGVLSDPVRPTPQREPVPLARRAFRVSGAAVLALLVLAAGVSQYRLESRALWATGLMEWVRAQGGRVSMDDPTVRAARARLREARRAFPWESRFALVEGRLLLAAGAPSAAAGAFAAASRCAPNDPAVWTSLADALVTLAGGNEADTGFLVRRAAETARRALTLCSVHGTPHETLARICAASASLADGSEERDHWARAALDHFRAALRGGPPEDQNMTLLHADTALSLGEVQEAASVLARGLERTPSMALWKLLDKVPGSPGTDALLFPAARGAYARQSALSAHLSGDPQARITAAGHLLDLSGTASPDNTFAAGVLRHAVAAHPDHPGILELLESLRPEGRADANTVPELLHRLFPERIPPGLPPHVLAGYGEPLTPAALIPALDSLGLTLTRHPTALSREGARTALLHVLERLEQAAATLPTEAVPTARMQELRRRIVGDASPGGATP